MLKKLLKYDLKSVFKYWWIAAVTSIGLSALGGLCISIVSSKLISGAYMLAKGKPEEKIYGWIMLLAGLGLWAYVAYLSM